MAPCQAAFRPLLVLVLVASSATSALCHEDDPKVVDTRLPYFGPGFRSGGSGDFLGSGANDPPLQFESDGVRLMSWLTLAELGGTQGNDCWGYVAPSGREYAMMGTDSGTAFVEVSDPTNAQVIAVMPGATSTWRDIKTYLHYAYVVTEGGGGIQVFDLDDIDNGVVQLVNQVTAGGIGNSHNVAIDTTSGYLYRCGGGSNGLRIYSLADPANPIYVTSWSNRYVHDAQIVTYSSGPWSGRQIAFCCSGFGNGGSQTRFEILDVTNKSNIFTRDAVFYSGADYSHQVWVDAERQYAYLNDEKDEGGGVGTRTIVFDISDLDNAFQATVHSNASPAIGHNLYVHGDLVFEANYRSGMRVYDITSRTAPQEVGYFDTWPGNDRATFNGLWSCYPFFPSGLVLGSDREKGLFVWWWGDAPVDIQLAATPEILSPLGDSVLVTIDEANAGDLVVGSAELIYDTGVGPVQAPLVALGGNQYRADFPAVACGSEVRWYVSAQSSNGWEWRAPAGAPRASVVSAVADSQTLLVFDDFETDQGWTVGVPDDDATHGLWKRVDPLAGLGSPADDFSTGGVLCWTTGTFQNVGGGKTSLVSPAFALSAADDPVVTYWAWFSNSTDGVHSTDKFRTFLSNDDGASWVQAHVVHNNGPEVDNGWFYYSLRVRDFFAPTDTVRVKLVAKDGGGPNIVEAAVDDFRIVDRACDDCNASAYCVTTANSSGAGARIGHYGSTSIAANDLVLTVTAGVPNQFGVFFYGPEQAQTAFGDGLLCIGAGATGLLRLNPAQQANANGEIERALDYTQPPLSSGVGAVTPGSTWYFQHWYRDPGGGPAGFNLSDGLQVVFCP